MTYVLPMTVMGVCYTRMGRHLWGSEIVGEETPALLKNYQNKKKVKENGLESRGIQFSGKGRLPLLLPLYDAV